MPMLESALELDSCPSSLKQRAIKAVAYRGRSLPDAILRNLFLSEDAAVAYRAFQMLGESPTNSVVLFSAIQQLDHFKRGYVEGQKLSNAVELLLLEVTSIIKNAIRQGALPQIQRERLKKNSYFFGGRGKCRSAGVRWLFVCGDGRRWRQRFDCAIATERFRECSVAGSVGVGKVFSPSHSKSKGCAARFSG